MGRILIKGGYVVTVDGARNVYPGGFIVVDEAKISAVGSSAHKFNLEQFDDAIDAASAIVVPGLINMHPHHWYTLFKGLAAGFASLCELPVPESFNSAAIEASMGFTLDDTWYRQRGARS